MSFLPEHADAEVMHEINMTPLIDVMLVLLIVFILADPAIQSAIVLTLPRASGTAIQPPADPVRLDIDAHGTTYWNGTAVAQDTLKIQALQAGAQDPQPVVRLSGDRAVPYERVLQTLATLQEAGLAKVSFMAQKP